MFNYVILCVFAENEDFNFHSPSGELGASSHPCLVLRLLWPLGGSVVPPEPAERRPFSPHVR